MYLDVNKSFNTIQLPTLSISLAEQLDTDCEITKHQQFLTEQDTDIYEPLNEKCISSISHLEDIPFIDDGLPLECERLYTSPHHSGQIQIIVSEEQNVDQCSAKKNFKSPSVVQKTVSFELDQKATANEEQHISLDGCIIISNKLDQHFDASKNKIKHKHSKPLTIISKRELNANRSTDHQRLSDINLSSLDNDAKNSAMSGHPTIYKTQFLNSKSVPALSHHTGKEGKFNSHSKSRSINSLTNNNKNSTHENGFYQNLSVYSAQHTNHQGVESRTQSSQHIFTPIVGTNIMPHSQQQPPHQQQQQQPHQQHIQSHHSPLIPVVGSDLMQINRPAHTLSETNITMNSNLQADNSNKTLLHLQDNVRQAQHNVDGSYGNLYENNKKQAPTAYPSTLDVNNSRFTNNHTPNLRMQQMLAPSMPDISSLQNQQTQQQVAKMPTTSMLYQGGNFESYHGVAKSMQNVNMVGYPAAMPTDYITQHPMDLTQKYAQPQMNMYRQQQENSVNIETQSNYQSQHQQQNHLKRQILNQQSHVSLEKPPLPPTATHPLFKSQQLSSSINYVASNLDPPKGGFLPNMLTMAQRKSMSGTNPWEREEREKEVEIRRAHVRKWREQQIEELSSIVQRTSHQEEQLKTLILERDFDRRVQELEEQGDENDAEQKDSYNALSAMQLGLGSSEAQTTEIKIANICDSYKSFQKAVPELPKSSEDYAKKLEPTAASQPKGILKNNRYDVTPASPSKAPKTTSFAEDCILHTENNNFKLAADLTQTYDSKNANNPDVVSISDNNNKYVHVEPPPPPERNSSFLLMSRQNQRVERVIDNANKINFTDALVLQQKKLQSFLNNNDGKHVSFQEVDNKMKSIITQPLEYETEIASALSKSKPTHSEYDILYDNNSSLFEADDSNSSSIRLSHDPVLWNTTVQSTPGVIGAQEVYRDPRQRRLAEKEQEQQQRNNEAVPEKLSFKEKMKMFALETGENQSPREKLKISKAQRDIDEVQ